MPTIAVDYDDTLVGSHAHPKGVWLPGADIALRQLLATGNRLIVHSCRANWPEGIEEIRSTLQQAGYPVAALTGKLDIHTQPGKPHADVYVDDRAIRFRTWEQTLTDLRAILGGGDTR